MYEHTKNVNTYYFAEIAVDADHDGNIYECRKRGFESLESNPDFLQNTVRKGSYGEDWSLRKVCLLYTSGRVVACAGKTVI